MRRLARAVLPIALIACLAPTVALGQAAKNQAPAKGAGAQPPAARPQIKNPEQVLATVNGQKVTKLDVIQYLSQFPYQPGNEQLHYDVAINALVNTKLLVQFLQRQKVAVPKQEIDAFINDQEEMAKRQGTSLADVLAQSGTSMEELRSRITQNRLWKAYLTEIASDTVLKQYEARNMDLFNGKMVRASQIQINLAENATAADKQKARDRLLKIKQEITSGKITFANAANKYSEAESNASQPSGGDVDWFPRRGLTEPFAAAAFALKAKGEITDPVETEYGMHLIQLTDTKDGVKVDFEQKRLQVLNQYGLDLQNDIVAKERKTAQIKVEPMPADLFPKAEPAKAVSEAPAKEKAKS